MTCLTINNSTTSCSLSKEMEFSPETFQEVLLFERLKLYIIFENERIIGSLTTYNLFAFGINKRCSTFTFNETAFQ